MEVVNEETFVQQGTITRIAVKNFMTYDDVVVKPGKNFNLIIGPNGTGKSSIVSAIVLGLGGNTNVIGRAQQIGHFVKSGQEKATIEIDLQNGPNKYITITRTFNLQNHSTWMVNNKTANNKQISDLMRSFNIQVDNLCQFLPQDKVADFSNLSPAKLLEETERSVGDPKLIEYHSKLKQFREKQTELEKDLESKARLQAKEQQVYDSLKNSVGHINEQKAIKKKLKLLKQKKAWILYQNKREEFEMAKKGRDEAENQKNIIAKKLKPVEQVITKLKTSIQGLEKTAKQHNSETSAKTAKLNKFLDDIEKHEKSIDDIEAQCERKIKEEQECDKRIDELKQQMNKMENDLKALVNDVGTVESLQAQLNANSPQINECRLKASDLNTQKNFFREQIDNINRKIRGEEQILQQAQDIENKRLDVLRSLSADAYKGVTWLRANRHLFSKNIYEPMLLHINLKDSKYSKYFENIIPQRDLTAFVCEDKSDMNLLLKYLRDQQKLRVNVVHSDPNRAVNYQPSIPLENIKQYGFEHYLLSLIDAPQTILNYLVRQCGLNRIPIGNNTVKTMLDQIPEVVNRFFSSDNSYSVSRSKYTGEKSTRQSAVGNGSVLSITIDTEKIRKIQKEITLLNEKRDALTQELRVVDEQLNEVHGRMQALKDAKNQIQINLDKIQNLKVRINLNDQNIKKLQDGRMTIDQIQSQYKQEIQAVILRQFQSYEQYNKLLDDLFKNVVVSEELKLQIKMEKNKLAKTENDSHDLKEEFNNAERRYKQLANELTPLKKELKESYDSARDSTGGLNYDDPNFVPIKNAFAKLPASIEELFVEIQTTQAKIFCLMNDQQDANRIVEQFNAAKKHLESLELLIKQKEEELMNITVQIEKVKGEWLPMLETLIEKINSNFSNYFTKMKCAGEVSLTKGDNEMDFDKYGLAIKVKFRDADELQALTRTHQSGGERAVTTAVYMIALQELTRVPFRCVDEINQGMDAANERRVFELIVNITSKSSSQYFMLTPKLLPNLKYNDSITVLTVFNARHMVSCAEFDINAQCDNIVEVVKSRRLAAVH